MVNVLVQLLSSKFKEIETDIKDLVAEVKDLAIEKADKVGGISIEGAVTPIAVNGTYEMT